MCANADRRTNGALWRALAASQLPVVAGIFTAQKPDTGDTNAKVELHNSVIDVGGVTDRNEQRVNLVIVILLDEAFLSESLLKAPVGLPSVDSDAASLPARASSSPPAILACSVPRLDRHHRTWQLLAACRALHILSLTAHAAANPPAAGNLFLPNPAAFSILSSSVNRRRIARRGRREHRWSSSRDGSRPARAPAANSP